MGSAQTCGTRKLLSDELETAAKVYDQNVKDEDRIPDLVKALLGTVEAFGKSRLSDQKDCKGRKDFDALKEFGDRHFDKIHRLSRESDEIQTETLITNVRNELIIIHTRLENQYRAMDRTRRLKEDGDGHFLFRSRYYNRGDGLTYFVTGTNEYNRVTECRHCYNYL